ncbi:alcohol dehydrogenase catalytic domain-containing protein [Streptomyces sp. NPDC003863]
MKRLVFVAPGHLRFDEVDAPTIVEGADALVRPLAATTCDLDHHVIADKTPFSGFGPFPLGHECVGTVVEVGPDCTDIAVGDIVGVAWHVACGTCAQCGLGHTARCLLHGDAQYGLPVNGAWGGTFDELIRVPYADFNLAKLPDGIDPVHLASIGDNLALGWETVMPTVAGITDPKIAVFGGTGSIGLYCVDVVVHCAGARTVYYDEDPVRMKVAEQLGAEVHDTNGKREKDFHLAVDASCNPEGVAVGHARGARQQRRHLLRRRPDPSARALPARSPLPQRQGARAAEHDADPRSGGRGQAPPRTGHQLHPCRGGDPRRADLRPARPQADLHPGEVRRGKRHANGGAEQRAAARAT